MQKHINLLQYSLIKRLKAINTHVIELATSNNELYKQNRRLKKDNELLTHRNNDLKAALNGCINLASELLPRENHFENDQIREFLIVLNKT